MKKIKLLPFFCLVSILCGCGGEPVNSIVNSSINGLNSTPSVISQPEGLYSKLTRGLEALTTTFTVDGTLEHAYTYDGANAHQDHFTCFIEVGSNSYYYAETELETGDVVVEDNYYENENGVFVSREWDFYTNKIRNNITDKPYKDVMVNSMKDAVVKDLKGIRGELNWYEIKNYTLASSFVNYLTGYAVGGEGYLTMTQFAMHFDGDYFDQFRILLTYDESEDDYVYYEEFLFTVNISNYGTTTPRVRQPLPHDDAHDKLRDGFNELAIANSYTMNVDVKYASQQAEPEKYKYLVDQENEMLFSTEVRTGTRSVNEPTEEDDGREYYNYNIGYKYVKDGTEKRLYEFDFDVTNNALQEARDYNGSEEPTSQYYRDFGYLIPKFGAIAPECFEYNQNNHFSSYASTYELCVATVLPYRELYSLGGMSFDMEIEADGSIKNIVMSGPVNYSISETNYITTTATVTLTITDVNITVLPGYFVEAGI